jgi:proline iminopeptidase
LTPRIPRAVGASHPSTELASNTTAHLLANIERLREHLGIDRWLVFGGS